MIENPYMSYLVVKERQRDFLAEADLERKAALASAGRRGGPQIRSRVLTAVGKRMVRLGLRLQGAEHA
jgi:hypothetical protein